MRDAKERYRSMVEAVPQSIKTEINLCFDISNKIESLMIQRGLTRKQFADAIGKRPCEVTKWLSGQHNFTISTLASISAFFNCPIVSVMP